MHEIKVARRHYGFVAGRPLCAQEMPAKLIHDRTSFLTRSNPTVRARFGHHSAPGVVLIPGGDFYGCARSHLLL